MTLIEAIKSNDLAAIKSAVKAEPKSAKDPRAAVTAGGEANQPALALLKKHGADMNAVWRGYRPLHNLLQSHPHSHVQPTPERLACLDWLLANGADPELPGAWPSARAIIIAAFLGEPSFVKPLLKFNNQRDGFVLAALGEARQFEKTLAKNPSLARDRDAGGLTALQCASGSRMPKAQSFEIARALLDAGADLSAKTKSWSNEVDAVYFAVGAKKRDVFELFLDRGADPTEALTPAAWSFNEELSQLAIDRGAQIDKATADGQPLLNNLIRWGQFKPAFWLLERGASPNVADDKGWTALHQAASGNEKILRALLEAGGDKTHKDKQGELPRDITTKDQIAALL